MENNKLESTSVEFEYGNQKVKLGQVIDLKELELIIFLKGELQTTE